EPALVQVQLRDRERLVRQVDSLHARAALRHRLGEDAAAASDVERRLAGEARDAVDPRKPQRVDLVQRLELALRVPPAGRQRAGFFELVGVGVHALHIVLPETKSPAGAGLFKGETDYFDTEPTASSSTRRFGSRHAINSFVFLSPLHSFTGWRSPLPS